MLCCPFGKWGSVASELDHRTSTPKFCWRSSFALRLWTQAVDNWTLSFLSSSLPPASWECSDQDVLSDLRERKCFVGIWWWCHHNWLLEGNCGLSVRWLNIKLFYLINCQQCTDFMLHCACFCDPGNTSIRKTQLWLWPVLHCLLLQFSNLSWIAPLPDMLTDQKTWKGWVLLWAYTT